MIQEARGKKAVSKNHSPSKRLIILITVNRFLKERKNKQTKRRRFMYIYIYVCVCGGGGGG
jgi:hypothetical protein